MGRDYQVKLCARIIYNLIYEGILIVTLQILRHKGKCHQPHETHGKFNIGKPIYKRPKSFRNRQEFGNWMQWFIHIQRVKDY